MRKALISTLSCLSVGLLLLAGTTPAALGQSAIENDAQVYLENNAQPLNTELPDTLHESLTGYYFYVTSIAIADGAAIGFGTGLAVKTAVICYRIVQANPSFARSDMANANSYTNLQRHLQSVDGSSTIWATSVGTGVGILVTMAMLFIFFSGYLD